MAETSLISIGDFVDIYHKIRLKRNHILLNPLQFSGDKRVRNKWNNADGESDYWCIPDVHSRWNMKCSGDPDMGYEEYAMRKYFSGKSNLSLLSVGCGAGSREQKFARHTAFSRIVGIDLAENQIKEAQENARTLPNVSYLTGDFRTTVFDEDFDVILFNSSLHHFDNISSLVEKQINPLLKPGGLLIIFEYAGPDRLQWTSAQLKAANRILMQLPTEFRTRWSSTKTKKHIYRPGLLRMKLNDPSEAVDSSSILPTLHRHFQVLEEHSIGTDIIHIVLKDIAHNFNRGLPGTRQWLQWLFDQEDQYLAETGSSDMVFGIYRK